jgi:hypothetical protein
MSGSVEFHEQSITLDPSVLPVRALHVVRRMRGGSNSFLILGDDGLAYVLKPNNNQQGPNLLANEVLGAELLRATGLPTPTWKPVFLSSELCAQTRHFADHTPVEEGFHFGSEFVSMVPDEELYEFLPRSYANRVEQPDDFLGVYILDVLMLHDDHRQAVFTRGMDKTHFKASFIDHGHLLGGPHWSNRARIGAAMCLDMHLYSTPWDDAAIETWISHFEKTIPPCLSGLHKRVLPQWYKGSVELQLELLQKRLGNLGQLFYSEVGHNPRARKCTEATNHDPKLPLRDSRTL